MDLNGPDVAAALNDPKWAARNTTLRSVSGPDLSLDHSRVVSVSLSLSLYGTYYNDGEWCENNSVRIRSIANVHAINTVQQPVDWRVQPLATILSYEDAISISPSTPGHKNSENNALGYKALSPNTVLPFPTYFDYQ